MRGAAPTRPPRNLRRDVRPVVPRRARARRTVARRRRCRRRPRGCRRGCRGAAAGAARHAGRQRGSGQHRRAAGGDDRADRRGVRAVQLQPRPVVLVVSGAQGDGLDDLEGRLLAGLLAPYGDEPTPTQEQIAKAHCRQRIAQLRQMVEAETKRRTAEQLGRDHVQMYGVPAARRERRVPACLRRAAAPDAARGGAAGAHAGHPAGGAAAAVAARRDRPAQDAAQVDVDRRRADRRGAQEAAPGPAGAGGAVRRVGSVAGFSHFTLLLVHALRQQFSRVRVFAFIDTTDEVTELFGPDADLAVAVQRITREAGVYTRDGHSDYGHAFVSFVDNSRMCCRRAARCWSSATAATTTAIPRPTCWRTWSTPAARALAQSRAQAPMGQRRFGGAALRGRHHHARMPVGQTARKRSSTPLLPV